MANYPSIFNDVIGPVMRGPSSSHCAAALRIGRLCRDLMDAEVETVHIELDPNGSLATTHISQGSEMGLLGGLLGWDAHDARLPGYGRHIQEAGITVKTDIVELDATHPNTYKLTLKNDREIRKLTAISVGGGMIEIIELEGAETSIEGDCFETLVFVSEPAPVIEFIKQSIDYDAIELHQGDNLFIEIKSQRFPTDEVFSRLLAMDAVITAKRLRPVLPILTRANLGVPFITCAEMLGFNADKGLALWQLAVAYESARGGIAPDAVYARMEEIVCIMQASIEQGLLGTDYADRILGNQSAQFKQNMASRRLVEGDALNTIILYVTAMMEVKSSMGVIVAAPTAGACGVLPGAVLGVATARNIPQEEIVKAMLAAGMVGVFIAAHATFAAEIGGCQAECGSGSGMAAAAIVSLANGTLAQALSAASVALQNSFGMICDPVANRVEAPCLGKNVMAASNALSCANMALADYDHLIPLDEVIEAMDLVGRSLPVAFRCTGLGGLSITKTSVAIRERLKIKN